jgi:hypothetical protein
MGEGLRGVGQAIATSAIHEPIESDEIEVRERERASLLI